MTRPRVILAGDLHASSRERLDAVADVIDARCGSDLFEQELQEAEGLVVRTGTRVDGAMLERAPRLRVIARPGAGLDNIDLRACDARNVAVVYAPGANAQAVAEYVMTLVCDALRPRAVLHAPLTPQEWRAARSAQSAPRQMSEMTFGILGMGHVGRRVARAAGGMGFHVLYHDLVEIPPEERCGASKSPLEGILRESDVLSIHVDGRPSNQQFLRHNQLSCLKPTVLLVNTARGFIVDNSDLRAFLDSHPLARALLDVHDREPVAADNPLWGCPNADLYPHLASRTTTAERAMCDVVHDLVAVLQGEDPRPGSLAVVDL